MAASYPSNIVSSTTFPTHSDGTEIIDASTPNNLQAEVQQIETYLGVNPHISTAPSSSGTFTATSTTYNNLVSRLANIETGIVSDAHSQYIRKTSDSANVIQTGSSSTKGLVIKASASQSANLLEIQDSSGNVLNAISSSGAIAGVIPSSVVTAAGDIIYATAAGTVTRLGIGANGTFLTSNGSAPVWANLSTVGAVSTTNGTVSTASTSLGVVRNIWTSTSAPSGGANGDIWIQYS